jgi:hypothetical protein
MKIIKIIDTETKKETATILQDRDFDHFVDLLEIIFVNPFPIKEGVKKKEKKKLFGKKSITKYR